jgi:outer membrane protein assembly factor BamB
VAGGVAYIGLGVYLIAFDALTGKILWQVPASDVDSSGQPTSIDFIDGQATLGGGNIYVCSGAYLYAFSTNKPTAYTWRFQTKKFDSNSATPVVGTGVVYFGGSNSRVYALKTS